MPKRYYWLKLPQDFFRQKEIKKLRRIAGGDTFTIIYLKMLLKAMNDSGKLIYEGVEPTFAEELALDLDEETDNVQMTVAFLESQGLLISSGEDENLLVACDEMTGSETTAAKRVRKHRDKQKFIENHAKPLHCNSTPLHSNTSALHCNSDVTGCNTSVTNCNTEREIERDREIEIDTDKEIDTYCSEPETASKPPVISLPLNTGKEFPISQSQVDEWTNLYPAVDIMQELRNMRGWCQSNPKKRKTKNGVLRFVTGWLSREQDKGHAPDAAKGYRNTQPKADRDKRKYIEQLEKEKW